MENITENITIQQNHQGHQNPAAMIYHAAESIIHASQLTAEHIITATGHVMEGLTNLMLAHAIPGPPQQRYERAVQTRLYDHLGQLALTLGLTGHGEVVQELEARSIARDVQRYLRLTTVPSYSTG